MLEAGGGRVVNLSSGAGADDRPVYSAYCAAKAGLFRLTGNLHLAGHDRGLRAFDVSPGVVRTDMTGSMAMHDDRTDWTPVAAVVDLVVAVARGELDAWSGRYLRAGVDTPASLAAAADDLDDRARRLRVVPTGPDDPAVVEPPGASGPGSQEAAQVRSWARPGSQEAAQVRAVAPRTAGRTLGGRR